MEIKNKLIFQNKKYFDMIIITQVLKIKRGIGNDKSIQSRNP